MSTSESPAVGSPTSTAGIQSVPVLAVRGGLGGTLMGLANLVPGISGGTMLLAAGVYRDFVSAVAEFTTLKFRRHSVVIFGAIVASAAVAILLLAGVVKHGVLEYRWAMYSTFIGLTLGGAPLVWRLGQPRTASFFTGAVAGLVLMVLMAFVQTGGADAGRSYPLLFLGGVAGASAMILPGVSGGYLLLLLGQYVPILSAVDQLKLGLLGDGTAGSRLDFAVILDAMHVVVPVGLGVVVGVAGVSNLIRWLLEHYEKPTLGVLFGLLIGAVAGLWPFQQAVPPAIGTVIRGVTVTQETLGTIDPDHWPVRYFSPTAGQVALAVGLILAGLVVTNVIDRIGARADASRGH